MPNPNAEIYGYPPDLWMSLSQEQKKAAAALFALGNPAQAVSQGANEILQTDQLNLTYTALAPRSDTNKDS